MRSPEYTNTNFLEPPHTNHLSLEDPRGSAESRIGGRGGSYASTRAPHALAADCRATKEQRDKETIAKFSGHPGPKATKISL